jgi:hypothetical protein
VPCFHDVLACTLSHISTLTALSITLSPQFSGDLPTATLASIHALARLPHLQRLTLPLHYTRHRFNESLAVALVSLPSLTHLNVDYLYFSPQVATAITQNVYLSELHFREPFINNEDALRILLRDTKTLTSLHIIDRADCVLSSFATELRKHLSHNTSLISFSHTDMPQEQIASVLARNRRVLYNWQCTCVLVAAYRANRASVIRDSILPLTHDVMSLVDDDVEIMRGQKT